MMSVLSPVPTAFRLSTLEQSESGGDRKEEKEENDKHKEWHALHSLSCAISKKQLVRGVLSFMPRGVRVQL